MTYRNANSTQLTIAIDATYKYIYKDEIYWILRLLLSTLGYHWQEVSDSEDKYDIYYGSDVSNMSKCKLYINLSNELWHDRNNLRLVDIHNYNECEVPIYSNNASLPHKLVEEENGTYHIKKDLLFDMFYLLTGQDEKYHPQNKHGFYDLKNSIYEQKDIFTKSLASNIGTFLRKLMLKKIHLATSNTWPNQKQAAIAFSHDVDYPEIIKWLEPFRLIRRQGLSAAKNAMSIISGKRHHFSFHLWRDLEQKYGINSTFYFVARQGSLLQYATGLPDPFYDVSSHKFINLFKELKATNAEIELHASYLAHTNPEQFLCEKNKLAEASQSPVDGLRHHYFQIDSKIPEKTLYLHQQLGFLYDSSLTHDAYIGWRRHCSWPHFPFYKEKQLEIKTLQLPLTVMDAQILSSKSKNRQQLDLCKQLIDRVIKEQGVFVINMHEYSYDAVLYPGYSYFYEAICKYVAEQNNCWIATSAEIAKYWVTRYKKICDNSYGLGVPKNIEAEIKLSNISSIQQSKS